MSVATRSVSRRHAGGVTVAAVGLALRRLRAADGEQVAIGGGPAVVVANGETESVAPSSYSSIRLGNGATLQLSSDTYDTSDFVGSRNAHRRWRATAPR